VEKRDSKAEVPVAAGKAEALAGKETEGCREFFAGIIYA
jgi:hypothetical protein